MNAGLVAIDKVAIVISSGADTLVVWPCLMRSSVRTRVFTLSNASSLIVGSCLVCISVDSSLHRFVFSDVDA